MLGIVNINCTKNKNYVYLMCMVHLLEHPISACDKDYKKTNKKHCRIAILIFWLHTLGIISLILHGLCFKIFYWNLLLHLLQYAYLEILLFCINILHYYIFILLFNMLILLFWILFWWIYSKHVSIQRIILLDLLDFSN